MKNINLSFCLICCLMIFVSCESNSLKQDNAESAIRGYVTNNRFETSKESINPEAIQKIGKTNVYTQFNTSVRVYFYNKEGKQHTRLLFIFTRTPRNKWFLESVESFEGASAELADWAKHKRKLKIPVQ